MKLPLPLKGGLCDFDPVRLRPLLCHAVLHAAVTCATVTVATAVCAVVCQICFLFVHHQHKYTFTLKGAGKCSFGGSCCAVFQRLPSSLTDLMCCVCCCAQVGVFVSIISTKIPFKGAGKEYIGDDIEEMVSAVKQAIQQCGVQLRVRP